MEDKNKRILFIILIVLIIGLAIFGGVSVIRSIISKLGEKKKGDNGDIVLKNLPNAVNVTKSKFDKETGVYTLSPNIVSDNLPREKLDEYSKKFGSNLKIFLVGDFKLKDETNQKDVQDLGKGIYKMIPEDYVQFLSFGNVVIDDKYKSLLNNTHVHIKPNTDVTFYISDKDLNTDKIINPTYVPPFPVSSRPLPPQDNSRTI